MVNNKPTAPGVYSATYSNIPVFEFQFGEGLKEHVMRRRHDDWINATHILKAAGFDKPARTRILEREVQKEIHEKVQGGYGKYQGTWVPLESGQALAQRNNIYEKLRTIFEYSPGDVSPPPAPKHTTNKPKLPKKPAVPRWGNMQAPARVIEDSYDNNSIQLNDDESVADDVTVASASYMEEDDRYGNSQSNAGSRKRKREAGREEHLPQQLQPHNVVEQAHVIYSDDLLDYFMLSNDQENVVMPEPPLNFRPDWPIDQDEHTAMHWAAAMGDVKVMRELKSFGANLEARNVRDETPLMRSVLFTNCLDKQTMPAVVRELIDTIDAVDLHKSTALHHAAMVTVSKHKHQCARYYLDIILNKMQEVFPPQQTQHIVDAQDARGDTATHIAARNKARKCVRALIGRGAATDIQNHEGITAEELIQELNESVRKTERPPQGSSSPYGPEGRHASYVGDRGPQEVSRRGVPHYSEASISIEQKIAPTMLEKFRDLAGSFDDELLEKDHSAKDSRRILNGVLAELETVREQNLALSQSDRDTTTDPEHKSKLQQKLRDVTSLIEQQQQIRLQARIQNGQATTNGQGSHSEQEKLALALQMSQEQKKRVELVDMYKDALSVAGVSEEGEAYKKLISKCTGTEMSVIDENLDSLVDSLEEDWHGKEGEVLVGEEM